jgi:hypothetical protein
MEGIVSELLNLHQQWQEISPDLRMGTSFILLDVIAMLAVIATVREPRSIAFASAIALGVVADASYFSGNEFTGITTGIEAFLWALVGVRGPGKRAE